MISYTEQEGHPQGQDKSMTNESGSSNGGILGANWKRAPIVLLIFFGPYAAWSIYAGWANSCTGMARDVIALSKENQTLAGGYLIDLVQIENGSETEETKECSALGLWSDSSRSPVSYRRYQEFGKWYLTYTPG